MIPLLMHAPKNTECRQIFDTWEELPKGLCMIRMQHERLGHVLHLKLKINDGPWYDQVPVPMYSEAATKENEEFWGWARENLPTWNYPSIVKSST